MQAIAEIEKTYRKPATAQVQSGDTVRVHQLIREGSKQRVQVFEGVVIRTDRPQELTASITVRRIASGVGVEKSFLLHSPNVQKVEVVRRSKVRRNFLSYLRARRGKSARLQELSFDKEAANVKEAPKVDPKDAEVAKLAAEQAADRLAMTALPPLNPPRK
jgi:large subunit ribosomal protein L19